MATSNTTNEKPVRSRLAWVVLGVLLLGGVVALVLNLRTPPQMGTDEAVFKTVDALYTAVRNRDEMELKKCEQRLKLYRESNTLPAASADYLDQVIAKARQNEWDTAAKWLYEFMLAQRREGPRNTPHQPRKS